MLEWLEFWILKGDNDTVQNPYIFAFIIADRNSELDNEQKSCAAQVTCHYDWIYEPMILVYSSVVEARHDKRHYVCWYQ